MASHGGDQVPTVSLNQLDYHSGVAERAGVQMPDSKLVMFGKPAVGASAAWLEGGMALGQVKYGCAARDSNPEPAD
jgi:hypothetical protein